MYPLHAVLVHRTTNSPDIAAMLIRHGAYLLTEDYDAFEIIHRLYPDQHHLLDLLLEMHHSSVAASALPSAVQKIDPVLFNRVLELPELDINLPDLEGRTALHLAIRKGRSSFV